MLTLLSIHQTCFFSVCSAYTQKIDSGCGGGRGAEKGGGFQAYTLLNAWRRHSSKQNQGDLRIFSRIVTCNEKSRPRALRKKHTLRYTIF